MFNAKVIRNLENVAMIVDGSQSVFMKSVDICKGHFLHSFHTNVLIKG